MRRLALCLSMLALIAVIGCNLRNSTPTKEQKVKPVPLFEPVEAREEPAPPLAIYPEDYDKTMRAILAKLKEASEVEGNEIARAEKLQEIIALGKAKLQVSWVVTVRSVSKWADKDNNPTALVGLEPYTHPYSYDRRIEITGRELDTDRWSRLNYPYYEIAFEPAFEVPIEPFIKGLGKGSKILVKGTVVGTNSAKQGDSFDPPDMKRYSTNILLKDAKFSPR